MRLSTDVLIELENCDIDGNHLTMAQMDRNLYQKVKKTLIALGGPWNKKEKAHVFECDPRDAIESAILTGEVTVVDLKKELQYFPTPPEVLEIISDHIDLRAGMEVLEPSAGEGNIATWMRAQGCHVYCVEKHEPFRDALRADDFNVDDVADFLELNPDHEEDGYDAIVANPPFTRQQDIDHVTHMLKFLKDTGSQICAVMSNGVTFRENNKTKAFRHLLDTELDNYDIIDLPPNAFKASGTGVNTVLLTGCR
jgi:predicted RNA methylase